MKGYFPADNCLPPCSGLMITSYHKSEPNENFEQFIQGDIISYNKYMKWFEYPKALKGYSLHYQLYDMQVELGENTGSFSKDDFSRGVNVRYF